MNVPLLGSLSQPLEAKPPTAARLFIRRQGFELGSQISPERLAMGLFQKRSTLDLRLRRDRFAFRPLNPPISPVATSLHRLSSARLRIGGCREALRTLESSVRDLQASAAW